MGCGCSSSRKLITKPNRVNQVPPLIQKNPEKIKEKKIKKQNSKQSLSNSKISINSGQNSKISYQGSQNSEKKIFSNLKKTKRKPANQQSSQNLNQSLGVDKEKYILEKIAMIDESIEKLEKSIEKLKKSEDNSEIIPQKSDQNDLTPKLDLNSVKAKNSKSEENGEIDDDISYSPGVLTIKRRLGSIASDGSSSKSKRNEGNGVKRVHSFVKKKRNSEEELKRKRAISQRLMMLKELSEDDEKNGEIKNENFLKKNQGKIEKKGKNENSEKIENNGKKILDISKKNSSNGDDDEYSFLKKKVKVKTLDNEGISEISLNYNLHEKMKKRNSLEKKLIKMKNRKISEVIEQPGEHNISKKSDKSLNRKKSLKIIYTKKHQKKKIKQAEGFEKQVVIKRSKKRKSTEKKFKANFSDFKSSNPSYNPNVGRRMTIGSILSKPSMKKKDDYFLKEKLKIEQLQDDKKNIKNLIEAKNGTVKLQRKSLIGVKKPVFLDKSLSQMSSILHHRSNKVKLSQEPEYHNSQFLKNENFGSFKENKEKILDVPKDEINDFKMKQRGSTFKMNKDLQENLARDLSSMLKQVKEDQNENFSNKEISISTEKNEKSKNSILKNSRRKTENLKKLENFENLRENSREKKLKRFLKEAEEKAQEIRKRRRSLVESNQMAKRYSLLRIDDDPNQKKRSNSVADFKKFKIVKSSNQAKKFSAKDYIKKNSNKVDNNTSIAKLNLSIGGLNITKKPLSLYSSRNEILDNSPENRQKVENFENFENFVKKNSENNSVNFKKNDLEISIDIANYNPKDDSIAIKSQKKFSQEDLENDENQEDNEELRQVVDEISKSENLTKSPRKKSSYKKSLKDSILTISVSKMGQNDKKSEEEEEKITYDLPPRSGKKHDKIDKNIEKRLSRFSNQKNSKTENSKNVFKNSNTEFFTEKKFSSKKNSNLFKENSLKINNKNSENFENSKESHSHSYTINNNSGSINRRSKRFYSDSLSRSKSRQSGGSSFTRTFIAEETIDAEGNDILNQFILLEIIGKGSFGKVRKAKNVADKKFYAVKIVNRKYLKGKMRSTGVKNFDLDKEYNIQQDIDHPNIVKIHEVITPEDSGHIYVVMDYVRRGYLGSTKFWKYRNKKKNLNPEDRKLTVDEIKEIFQQIVNSIHYLHNEMNIAHRDIKLQNLLVGDGITIKLCDFGISEEFKEKENDLSDLRAGTVSYHPPEIYTTEAPQKISAKACDIWSLGCVLYYLITGNVPFSSVNRNELIKKIKTE